MVDRLILCASQHWDKATNYKRNGLKDNIGKSIADQEGKVR